mgnify:CR=1 FL=1|tara:strand:+ start:249 stop:1091 length:843 start_codon:yes stop_codon:yes gene_type:complete
MAKKQTAAKAAPTVEVEQPEIKAANKIVEVAIKKPQPKKPEWEIKDRTYYLTNNKSPLSYKLKTTDVYHFDEEKGYERELKYTSNQRTPFVDEFVGDGRLEHVIFRNGVLNVPKSKTVLQKMLSLYHPQNGVVYAEMMPQKEAASELDFLEFQVEALSIAKDLDIDTAEAVMRVELGSKVSKMSSKELRRDLLLFARKNPALFLELTTDENVTLRNFGIKANEFGIIKLSSDQRTFTWENTGRKLMTVPYGEHPYSALAAWFKTDEGLEVYASIEKRLSV